MLKDFRENDIEILVSTMNQHSLDFLLPMFPFLHFSNFLILIVNQTQIGKILNSEYSNIKIINSFEKGLSKSRNLAIKNATGKILLIADDDVIFQEGFTTKIIKAYNRFSEATVINFCALKANGDLVKKYPNRSKINLSILDILNTSSVEMTLNRVLIEKSEIFFDENFGLGGTFEVGEEAVFLWDLKQKKQKLVFELELIVKHEGLTSSDKIHLDEKYYIQGALFSRIFRNNYIYWIFIKLLFDLKQNKVKFRELKLALKNAKKGHQKFETISHENKE